MELQDRQARQCFVPRALVGSFGRAIINLHGFRGQLIYFFGGVGGGGGNGVTWFWDG